MPSRIVDRLEFVLEVRVDGSDKGRAVGGFVAERD
jgi:hypothetical protein